MAKVCLQTSCYFWLCSPTRFTNAYNTDRLTKLLQNSYKLLQTLTKLATGAEVDGMLLTVWADCHHATVCMCMVTVCTSTTACLALQVRHEADVHWGRGHVGHHHKGGNTVPGKALLSAGHLPGSAHFPACSAGLPEGQAAPGGDPVSL